MTPDNRIFDGRLPTNLSSMSPSEIGEYYGMMVVHTDYVEGKLALAAAATAAAEEKLKVTKAAVRKTKTGSAQQKDDSTIVDSRYVEANANLIKAKTYRDLVKTTAEAARRDIRFISRLIETKRMEFEQHWRGGSIDRLKHGQRPSTTRPKVSRPKRPPVPKGKATPVLSEEPETTKTTRKKTTRRRRRGRKTADE